MKFYPDADQEMIQDTVRRTAAGLASRRRVALDGGAGFDVESWNAVMATGLGGMLLPEIVGGSALGLVDAALAFEALGEEAVPGPFLGHSLAGLALARGSDQALAARWLPALASGAVTGMTILHEGVPDADWPRADGGAVSGTVALCAGAAGSEIIVLHGGDGDIGVVEVGRGGVDLEPVAGSDPTRPMLVARFERASFRPLGLDPSARERLYDAALILLAADALGGAEHCLALTVDFAKLRSQFGRPIGSFQAVKHQLADLALGVEPARALLWYAALAWDSFRPDARRAAAHAKAHLADRFVAAARAAIELHGGIGYTWEHDLHIWFRRSLHDHAYLGAPSLHRERAAAMAGW